MNNERMSQVHQVRGLKLQQDLRLRHWFVSKGHEEPCEDPTAHCNSLMKR